MANNVKYARKFIILKKEYSNMRNLNPKGHGKMELRGSRLNISLNIENGEKNTNYNVVLLSGIKEYELGKIYLENRTKGKGEFTLNYKDLESAGFSLDKINAILILRDDKVLLGNYINKEDGSIERYLNENIGINSEDEELEETQEGRKIEGVELEEVEKEVEEETQEDIELEQMEETFEEKKAEEAKKVEEIEEENELIEDEITHREYEEAITTVFEPNHSKVNIGSENKIDKIDKTKKTEKRDQTTDYILNILSFFPYAEPFKIDLKGYNWWRIDIDNPLEEKGFLPYFSYITGGNQKYPLIRDAIYASELMRIHKHYIFGLYNEGKKVKFYVYGVSGKFTSKEHPGRGLTGFSTWFESGEEGGYWLLYIEPSTGRIIYPINPMIPKD